MFGVLIPVGPDPLEVSRLHMLVAELGRHERLEDVRLVVVDDAPQPRDLGLSCPEQRVVRTPLWERGRPDVLSAHVAGTLTGLRAAGDVDFVLKLDTDAGIIQSFSGQLGPVLRQANIGVVGSYDRAPGGGVRDWSRWKRLIDRADWPLAVSRRGRWPGLVRRTRAQRAVVGAVRERAYRFAPPGAHCLGGAYAVSRAFLGSVCFDWRPWVRTQLGEDVVVGLLGSAAGLTMRSLTAPGEPFAVTWRGLPAPPAVLAAQGHSIVHSVRGETEQAERQLRDELQRLGSG